MSQFTDEITHDVSSTPELNADDRHKLLETERRRMALRILATKNAPVGIHEVAEEILATEQGPDPESDAVDRLARMLHHIDLPIMATANVLDYDSTTRRIDPHSIPTNGAPSLANVG